MTSLFFFFYFFTFFSLNHLCLSIKSWSFRRDLDIDVAVIHPLAASHLGKAEPCESYAQTQKSIVMLPPSFIPITISPQLSSRLVAL